MSNHDLIMLMKERAETVQAIVSKISSFYDACRYTVELTRHQKGENISAPDLAEKEHDIIRSSCRGTGIKLLANPFDPKKVGIHTSLPCAQSGIAETGTLILNSHSEDIRIATMLAETHVAILPAEKIRPDADSLVHELSAVLESDTPSYTAFITGASRTSDIERVLTIGVHGPRELHILIIEDEA